MTAVVATLGTYPYFFSTLGGIAAVMLVACIAMGREQRWMVLASGLLLVPAFPAAVVFNQNYWSPVRIGGWVLGIEDLLFTFLAGSGSWLLAAWPFKSRLVPKLRMGHLLRRYVISMSMGGLVFFLLLSSGLGSMGSTLALYGVWLVVLLFIKRNFWRVALCGALTFGTLYPLLLTMVFRVWPDYISQFNGHSIWCHKAAGLVVGEIAWGLGFAASWPLFLTFIFNMQWRRLPAEQGTSITVLE